MGLFGMLKKAASTPKPEPKQEPKKHKTTTEVAYFNDYDAKLTIEYME